MLKKFNALKAVAVSLASVFVVAQASATTITFDDLISGETSYLYDGNNNGNADVIFSTIDTGGFSTSGPGMDQLFVNEPGLEGGTQFGPDLRIDLLRGGLNNISFGFATVDVFPGVVQVYDASNKQIGSQVFVGEFFNLDDGTVIGEGDVDVRSSGFPENFVDVGFDGVAAYVTIDFDGDFGRYILDDFTFNESQDTIIDLFAGADPDFPIMPDPFDPANPEFRFELEIIEDGLGTLFPIFIDPIVAVGYTYEVESGPNFETVIIPAVLPNGDGEFIIVIDGVEYPLFAGVSFDIEAMTGILGGVSFFEIIGISTDEALDPADAMAFNTGVTFVSAGTVRLVQTPITFDTDPVDVSTPSTWVLLMGGLFGLAYRASRKKA